MKHDAYMSKRQQLILAFEQETGKNFDEINGLCCRSYTEWLEERLSTIVQQPLSGSQGAPKCLNTNCIYYNEKFDMNCDANEDLCEKCLGTSYNGKRCVKLPPKEQYET